MRIHLLHESLSFISTGRGKMHAQDSRYDATMCGQHIPPGTQAQVSRQIDGGLLCKRCTASLSTYTGRLGALPKVRFEWTDEGGGAA